MRLSSLDGRASRASRAGARAERRRWTASAARRAIDHGIFAVILYIFHFVLNVLLDVEVALTGAAAGLARRRVFRLLNLCSVHCIVRSIIIRILYVY